MRCFANLYFDEDVSVVLARVLVGRGFGVLTASCFSLERGAH